MFAEDQHLFFLFLSSHILICYFFYSSQLSLTLSLSLFWKYAFHPFPITQNGVTLLLFLDGSSHWEYIEVQRQETFQSLRFWVSGFRNQKHDFLVHEMRVGWGNEKPIFHHPSFPICLPRTRFILITPSYFCMILLASVREKIHTFLFLFQVSKYCLQFSLSFHH